MLGQQEMLGQLVQRAKRERQERLEQQEPLETWVQQAIREPQGQRAQ